MIGGLVLKNQSVFVPGRNIVDGVIMVNEALDMARRDKIRCMILKVGFEKLYDCGSWKILSFLLPKTCFKEKWLRWIEASVFNRNMYDILMGVQRKISK